MELALKSDNGIVRQQNEDCVFAQKLNKDTAIVIVADGMGGHSSGEYASNIAVDVMKEYLMENFSNSDKEFLLRESIKSANYQVLKKAKSEQQYNGMGTTVVAGIFTGNILTLANVGDSRAYLLRKDHFNLLTKDHSLVYELMERGEITYDEMRTHPQKNIITRAVGTDVQVEIDTFLIKLQEKDLVLFCSDGLSGVLADEEMKAVLKEKLSLQKKADKLIALANEKGGPDNITAAMIDLQQNKSGVVK